MYIFIASGPANGRYKLKLCPDHAVEFVDHVDQELAKVAADKYVAYPTIDRCMSCVLPMEQEQTPVIITAYLPNQEQQQWIGGLHATCAIPEALGYWLQNALQAA